MTKKELIERLNKFPDDTIVMIMDSFNGGGYPREINSGPLLETVTQEQAEESADCEELVGQQVLTIGYGFY